MPVEPMIVQPTSPLLVVEPAAEAGADDVDIAEHHRRAGRQAGLGGGGFAQEVVLAAAVDDGRQQAAERCDAEMLEHVLGISAGRKLPKVKLPLRRVGRALAGQLEIEPVLAMERGFGARQHLGAVALQPGELHALLAGVHAGAGRLVSARG